MMMLGRLIAAGLLAVAGGTFAQAPAAKPAAPPPVEAFFDYGSVRDMRLSPNGRWLAAQVVPAGGGPVRLVVSDLEDKEPAQAVVAFSRFNVGWFRWANDDLLIAAFVDNMNRGAGGGGVGLLSVTRDGKSMRHLIKAAWDNDFVAPGGIQPLEGNHRFATLGEPGSDEIILTAARYDRAQDINTRSLVLMNARTGVRRTLLKSLPEDTTGYLFDPRGRPRLAFSYREGHTAFHWYDPDKESWRQIARFKSLEWPYTPRFVDGKGQLYVSQSLPGGKGEELRRFDFAKDQPGNDPIVSTPGYDSGFSPILARDEGELLGVQLTLDADETVWIQPQLRELQRQVDARIPGRINRLLCARCDRQEALLVYSYSDRAPGDYLLYRPRGGSLQRMGASRPAIDAAAMAPVHFERIKARDGLELPVYITLPGGGAAKGRPAVVLVHGGPNSRGRDWSWEPESQFLASRGYVVIEPEFRGSTGFGDAHFRAGFKQWGRAMQDDLSDAVAWAVKRGWVDPARVCIAGASYGGYAAFMGLTRPTDNLRCGISWVGVSDMQLLFNAHWDDVSRSAKRYSDRELIGDPVQDAAYLEAVSPIKLADRIKAPLLVAYGAMDRRVPIEHGERMRAALKKAGQEPEWVVYDNEGHGWNFPETKKDFWGRVERFLARNLAP